MDLGIWVIYMKAELVGATKRLFFYNVQVIDFMSRDTSIDTILTVRVGKNNCLKILRLNPVNIYYTY
jgi:hypothetical protein